MEENKKTVGSVASELMQKTPDSRDPIELQREMQKEYSDNLLIALNDFKKTCDADFFIVVLTKKEKLLQNVIRNYFFGRNSCPTPEYDQSVFRYNRKDDALEYLWTLPSKDTCELMYANAMQVQEKALLQCVLDFYDGTLEKLAKKWNNEITNEHLILLEEA